MPLMLQFNPNHRRMLTRQLDTAMLSSSTQDSVHSIIYLGEQLCRQLSDMDIVDLQNKLLEYNEKIKKHFSLQRSRVLTQVQQEELEQLILFHKKTTEYFSNKKEKLSKNIKQIHSGKKIKNTYS